MNSASIPVPAPGVNTVASAFASCRRKVVDHRPPWRNSAAGATQHGNVGAGSNSTPDRTEVAAGPRSRMRPFRLPSVVRLTLIMSALYLAFIGWIMLDRERHGRASAPVQDFLAFADGTPGVGGVPREGLEHEYTAEGIVRLAAAIEALSRGSDRRTPARLTRLRQQADLL